jgi:hypothetical protein
MTKDSNIQGLLKIGSDKTSNRFSAGEVQLTLEEGRRSRMKGVRSSGRRREMVAHGMWRAGGKRECARARESVQSRREARVHQGFERTRLMVARRARRGRSDGAAIRVMEVSGR